MTEQTFAIGVFTGALAGALVGIVPALFVMLILVCVDLLTGIWASCSNDVKIESHKLRKTVYKLLAYLSVITLSALIDGAIAVDWHLGSFVATFCAVVELQSIVENFGRITHHDVFEGLRNALGRLKEKKYGKYVSKSETTEHCEMGGVRPSDHPHHPSDSIRECDDQAKKDN